MKVTCKALVISVIFSLTLLLPVLGLASPEVISNNYNGNVGYLISIKSPETAYTATSNKNCVISAVGLQSTTVTLYSYNPSDMLFHKMYANGAPLETVIGASGLYAQQISLKDGDNLIMVYATRYANEIETVRLGINVLSQGFLNNIKVFNGNYNMFN